MMTENRWGQGPFFPRGLVPILRCPERVPNVSQRVSGPQSYRVAAPPLPPALAAAATLCWLSRDCPLLKFGTTDLCI